jgi:hypothetical protein
VLRQIADKGGEVMSKQEAVMHSSEGSRFAQPSATKERITACGSYKAAIAVFRKWLESGFITADEFAIISTNTAEKYGIRSTSIYLEISPD